MGVSAKWSAEVQSRGDQFWQVRAPSLSSSLPADSLPALERRELWRELS